LNTTPRKNNLWIVRGSAHMRQHNFNLNSNSLQRFMRKMVATFDKCQRRR
jgi:hypothetical protein